MCLTALREDDAIDQPIRALLRSELDGALRNGLVAAMIVLLVTLSWGAPTAAILVRTTGALLLGVALYLGVLLTGTAALRLRRSRTLRVPRST